MPIRFDAAKEKGNQAKHGVSLTEADRVLSDTFAITVEDELADGEQRFITLGMNEFGFLRVVVWTGSDEEPRIISARKANRKEAKEYEKAL